MGVRASRLTKLVGDRRFKQVGFTPLTPKGYVPLCVGVNNDMRRFIVHRETLCDKDFSEMLSNSAEEYGFCNEGVLRIRCEVKDFEECIMRRTKWKIVRVT
ncbi:17.4 kDa class III heat shock family protein [Hibiscus syriacus]|uniref:17.4 kDa class III heat shock family protein n=1 Tax=Hibiscus syriacus TaxID=106335 RepID=A0A6A3BZF6_HIBSY|nr:auxin-responsive protein SAUR71-like [Hibiscus syriacus]KAE8721337.1 17.4 kDa class III heat shock family protein [Hibiscus syriacus]